MGIFANRRFLIIVVFILASTLIGAASATQKAPPGQKAVKKKIKRPVKVSFGDLSKLKITRYKSYEDFKKRLKFPKSIKKLNGKKITIKGYMLPLDEPPKTKHFLLLKRPIKCCYFCDAPKINEIVEVELLGNKKIKGVINKKVRVMGVFKVGLKEDEELMLNSIYRIEAEGAKSL